MQTSGEQQRLLFITVALVAAVTLIRIAILRASPLELYPDEAQYWWWAQTPDIGYFSKPPLIAWIIRVTTFLFGDREWAIRVGMPVFHAGTSLLVYALARAVFPEEGATACLSALAYLTLPGVSYSAGQASTDAPLLFFWALASFAFIRAIQTEGWLWPLTLGAAMGLGMLAKYAMLYFVLGALLPAIFDRRIREFVLGRRALVSLLLAALIVAPNIVWNASHGFATLSHTEADAQWIHANYSPLGLLAFLASQFGVFGPVLMAGWLVALWRTLRDGRRTIEQAGFHALGAAPLVLVSVQSFVAGANANWAAPAYVTAVPLAVSEICRRWPRSLLWLSFAAGGAVQVLLWVLLLRPAAADSLGLGNVFKRQEGWHDLAGEVSAQFSRGSYQYVVTNNRSVTAELLYYVRPLGTKIRVWDASLVSHNHFEMTMRLSAPASRALVIVAPRGAPQVLSTFESSRFLERVAASVDGQNPRVMYLYDARNYRGPEKPRQRNRGSPP